MFVRPEQRQAMVEDVVRCLDSECMDGRVGVCELVYVVWMGLYRSMAIVVWYGFLVFLVQDRYKM